MKNYLYPLTWNEFDHLHRKAWENGWSYGPAFHELYNDYLVNWVYFVDYLDILIKTLKPSHNQLYFRDDFDIVRIPFETGEIVDLHVPNFYSKFSLTNPQINRITILIGEAPPFWGGNYQNENRSYFYNPLHTNGSTWLNAPYKYFQAVNKIWDNIVLDCEEQKVNFKSSSKIDKIDKLFFLASQGVLLIDIFPFPIHQSTKVRECITKNFSDHLEDYFEKIYLSIKQYLINLTDKDLTFEYALVAPIYTSLQVLYGNKSGEVFSNITVDDKPLQLYDFCGKNNVSISTFTKRHIDASTSFGKYFSQLAFSIEEEKNLKPFPKEKNIFKTPVLIDKSGNVNFCKFYNHSNYFDVEFSIGVSEDDKKNIDSIDD